MLSKNKITITISLTLLLLVLGLSLSSTNSIVIAFANIPRIEGIEDTTLVGYYLPIINRESPTFSGADWYMAGANPQRTSWVGEEVEGSLQVDWYRPIEAYIDMRTQVIAVDGILYISSARGLYALNAPDGSLRWRFDTEMPLGNSPTVVNGVVYVGGFDKKVHALNSLTGQLIWESQQAGAGFEANPVVVNNKVYIGNRDGYFYAYNTHDGSIAWRFPEPGKEPLRNSISQSAAYDRSTNSIYFAGNDMYAYALDADDGTLQWKSDTKLGGQDFRSFWPVIYQDYVVFITNSPYRHSIAPGSDSSVYTQSQYPHLVPDLLIPDCSNGEYQEGNIAYIGPRFTAGSSEDTSGIDWLWPDGTEVIDASALAEILRDKPYLQHHIYMNKYNGAPLGEPAPIVFVGNNGNGTGYPPVVLPDGVIYQSSMTSCIEGVSPFSPIVGWHLGTPYLSIVGLQTVVDEPQEISGGGNRIYRRRYMVEGSSRDISSLSTQNFTYWYSGNLIGDQAPGYDIMNHTVDCAHALGFCSWYGGKISSINGIYGGGRTNPLIPHEGMLFLIDGNAVIAFRQDGYSHPLPLLEINPIVTPTDVPGQEELLRKLEAEIQNILEVYTPQSADRFLMPGYYNDGQNLLKHHDDYFKNPGETLYTLSLAYPHLSSTLQSQLSTYLYDYYQTYFGPTLYADTGWAEGETRSSLQYPPEVMADLVNHPKTVFAGSAWTWRYPQFNIYALWKYAQINSNIAQDAYNKAKAVIEFHYPDDIWLELDDGTIITYADRFIEFPFELQSYVAGYIGFLGLYDLVGQPAVDINYKIEAEQKRDSLLNFRYQSFSKDSYWYTSGNHHNRKYNIAYNFMWLVPEVGEYLHQNINPLVQDAIVEYNYAVPYWFVNAFQASYLETSAQPLYDSPALFQAKAWIIKENQQELYKYLDVPTFERGDLFYIQNLVALIDAPTTP